ncbi:uncharacterized protein [Pocillopora verrucosa]|uniref:uncharacterized protein n=1 Tax=Pocillopora verrucosa TaxID=203993 RepID=UPI002797A23A|nr:uncharacterized protein LOC131791221 [Pocillopora verrucosa]
MAYAALRNIRFSRESADTKREISFPIIYLGSVQVLCPVGNGICGSVEEIFDNSRLKLKHNLLPKQILRVKDNLFELYRADEEEHATRTVYNFNKIIYCGVDSKRRKVLVFNYHHLEGREGDFYLTHAFWCEKKSVAKQLAFTVGEYFQKMNCVCVQDADEMGNEESPLTTKLKPSRREKYRKIPRKRSLNKNLELNEI